MYVTFLNQETENRWDVVLTYKMPPHPKSVTTLSPKVSTARLCLQRSHKFPKQSHLLAKCLSLCLYTGRSDHQPQWARTESRKEVQLVRLSVDPHALACFPSKTMCMAEKHISRSSKWLHLSPGKWARWLLRKHPRFAMLFIYVGNK